VLSAVRTMKPGDVSSAMELSTVANWNQTREDWRRMMQLSAEGCRCIEHAGRVIATASLLRYGSKLAWIGMVLTQPEYRSQGFARRLVEDAIIGADRGGIRTVKLDATDEGRPLYESLGFVVEKTVERWGADGRRFAASAGTAGEEEDARERSSHGAKISDELFCRDAEAFGVTRKGLLEALSAAGRCNVTKNGYVLSRPGRTARYLGPCVASSEAEARQLIAARLEDPACMAEEDEASQTCSWYWDLLPSNPEAVRCAARFGFTRRRRLWRMCRGEAIEGNDAMVYAIAGFEWG
jgi:GNAT superfamily N-acetyltransferase